MPERTFQLAQRCTAEEAAAIIAAISAFEDGRARPADPGGARRWSGPPEPASGRTVFHGRAGESSTGTCGIVWKRGESSLGRGA